MERKIFLLIVLSFLIGTVANAQDYPTRSISFIIGLPPGGSSDLANRLICKAAEKHLGQPIVPVNKPGGGTSIAASAIAAAKPDGYTIGAFSHSGVYMYPLLEKVPYHPIKDIRYIIQFGDYNMGIYVRTDSPFKSWKEIIDYAQKNPKKLIYGVGGVSTTQNVIMEQIYRRENIQLACMPFTGGPELETALLGNHISLATGDFNYSLYEAKQIRLIALIRDKRSPEYPQTPCLKDLGYDIPCPLSLLVGAPKGLPGGVFKKLEMAFTKAMDDPIFQKGMKEDLHLSVAFRNSQDANATIASNYEFYAKFLKEIGYIK